MGRPLILDGAGDSGSGKAGDGGGVSELVDVVAVNRETGVVKILGRDKTQQNADGITMMHVARRAVMNEFIADTEPGKYQDGDLWEDE